MDVQRQRQAQLQQRKPTRFPSSHHPRGSLGEAGKGKEVRKQPQAWSLTYPGEESRGKGRAADFPNCCKSARFFGNSWNQGSYQQSRASVPELGSSVSQEATLCEL